MSNKTQNLFSFVSTLAGVQRFSLLKQVHKENCLEHTGMVAIFVLTLGTQINERDPGENIAVNMRIALSKAIVHDWDETVTGDVVRPTKYFSAALREEMYKLERSGMDNIAYKLEVSVLKNYHVTAKEGVEGYLVAFCDLLAATHRVWEEVLVNGNGHMIPCARPMGTVFSKMNANRPAATAAFHAVLDEHYTQAAGMLEAVSKLPQPYVEMMTP